MWDRGEKLYRKFCEKRAAGALPPLAVLLSILWYTVGARTCCNWRKWSKMLNFDLRTCLCPAIDLALFIWLLCKVTQEGSQLVTPCYLNQINSQTCVGLKCQCVFVDLLSYIFIASFGDTTLWYIHMSSWPDVFVFYIWCSLELDLPRYELYGGCADVGIFFLYSHFVQSFPTKFDLSVAIVGMSESDAAVEAVTVELSAVHLLHLCSMF